MSESRFRDEIRDALRGYAFTRRIEDLTGAGLPDIAYVVYGGHAGWLEAKYLPAWPKRDATPVTIRSLTNEQVIFLETWRKYGGRAYLALRVGNGPRAWWGILPSATARMILARSLTAAEVMSEARGHGRGRITPEELVPALR